MHSRQIIVRTEVAATGTAIRSDERRDAGDGGLVVSQMLALQVIRRALGDGEGGGAEGCGWRDVGCALRLAHAQMLAQQSVGLVVAEEAAVLLTRHEKRLLRATAAAQRADPALVDNLVFTLAPGRNLRPFLIDAIERLATGLTRHGHHLPLRLLPAAPTTDPEIAGEPYLVE